jgi:hypothetical protein
MRQPLRSSVQVLIAGLMVSVWFTGPLRAQDTRSQMIRDATEAYDNFETGRALQLLVVALNPNLGATNDTWAAGVQLLTQILIEQGSDSLAGVWMRWAVRTEPDMEADSITYLPEVVAAYRAARIIVGTPTQGDVASETSWDWSASAGGELGALRITSDVPVPLQVRIREVGTVRPGERIDLRPSSYRMEATAEGYIGAEVEREVLPGVETVVQFNLQRMAVADSVLYAAAETAALRQLGRVRVERYGTDPSCAAGAFVGADGLFLTTYTTIRGGEAVELELADGQLVSEGISVASYDTDANVAVLKVPLTRGDSLDVSPGPAEGQYVWALGYPGCASAEVTRLNIAGWPNRPVGALQLSDSLDFGPQGGPLIDQTGAVVGLLEAYRSAVPADRTAASLDEARRNINQQQLMALREVAERENHLYGAVDISSDVSGSLVRIEPLDSWHWPEAAATGALPFIFTGPMGRYGLEVLVDDQLRHQQEFTISPSLTDQLALALQQIAQAPTTPQAEVRTGGGKKFPWPIALIGVAGAGAAVALLAGGGGEEPPTNGPPTGPGSITITIPNP